MNGSLLRIATSGTVLILALSAQTSSGPGTNTPNTADQQFLQQAVQSGDMELSEARSQLHSSDPNIQRYAQLIIRDHTLANGQLVSLAQKDNINVSQQNVRTSDTPQSVGSPPPAAQRAESGPAMTPKDYMQHEISDHQQAIALVQGEINNGQSAEIRTLAKQMLPVLQGHLQMAQQYMSTGQVTPVPTPSAPAGGPGR